MNTSIIQPKHYSPTLSLKKAVEKGLLRDLEYIYSSLEILRKMCKEYGINISAKQLEKEFQTGQSLLTYFQLIEAYFLKTLGEECLGALEIELRKGWAVTTRIIDRDGVEYYTDMASLLQVVASLIKKSRVWKALIKKV